MVNTLEHFSVTWILGVAVAVPDGANSVMLCLALAGSPFTPKQAAGLVHDS